MKKIPCTFILLSLLFNVTFSQAKLARLDDSKVEFLIKADGDWKGMETPKPLTLTLKNNGTERVMIKELREVERNYTVEVTDSRGKTIALTAEGKRLTTPLRVEMGVKYARIKPGQLITRTLNLSKLYSLKEGKKYTIKVTVWAYVESERAYQKLNSNIIKVFNL
jgi:hypothetical protein